MKLAIQLLCYKSSSFIGEALESLQAQTFKDFHLFVCDNSMDAEESSRVRALLEKSGLPFTFIASDKNIGFAGANAMLYGKHDASFVMLLNDDAKLDAGYLEAALKRIESNDKIGSVTGLVYRADGKEIDTAGLEYLCLAQIVDRHIAPKENGLVFGVSGAVGMYRRSAVDKAGGLFDPTWFMYREDVDLALRLKRAGFTAWYEPKAIAWHKRGLKEEGSSLFERAISFKRRSPILRRYSYVNQWRIYRHYWKDIDAADRRRSILVELKRSLGVLLISPIVFVHAWYDLARS